MIQNLLDGISDELKLLNKLKLEAFSQKHRIRRYKKIHHMEEALKKAVKNLRKYQGFAKYLH